MKDIRDFSLKFSDVIIAVILGLGFQWWFDLKETWQYIAFVFVYIDIIDYWVDYSPSVKKFPPKTKTDLLLNVFIMFCLFFYLASTRMTIWYFLSSFASIRILDYFLLLAMKNGYNPSGKDKIYIDTWLNFNLVYAVLTIIFIIATRFSSLNPLIILFTFFTYRIIMRVWSSFKYKSVFFE